MTTATQRSRTGEQSATRATLSRRRSSATRAIPATTMLWVLAILMAFPLLWFLLSSFKGGGELFSYPLSFLPRKWTVDGYVRAWARVDFLRYFS
ncbi:MAG: hypothetical protein J0I87_07765, partial [Cellulomonas sp.]|nr:hypothetical protein [Cellulomonas sp.]